MHRFSWRKLLKEKSTTTEKKLGSPPNSFYTLFDNDSLVIIDVLMPIFDGVDVAMRIRFSRPDMPIVLTGFIPPAGADAILTQPLGFVFQPVDGPELLATMRRLLPDSSSHCERVKIEVHRRDSILISGMPV
jgi:DNA-binding response OmpR family regulator